MIMQAVFVDPYLTTYPMKLDDLVLLMSSFFSGVGGGTKLSSRAPGLSKVAST